MPETPIIIKGGSVIIAFDQEKFEEDGGQGVRKYFGPGVEVLQFNNRRAKILRVEITDGDQCGTIRFEPKNGKCTIKIVCEVPYGDQPRTRKSY